MSSKLYVLRNDVDGLWCAAYFNGKAWRISTRDTRKVKTAMSRWWSWIGNPVKDLNMELLCEVNNFKEKDIC